MSMPQDHRPPRADVIDVLVTIDVVEKRPLRTGHERRFAADRPERPRRAVHPAGNHAIGAEEGVVALGKRELGLRSGGSFEGHGLSEIYLREIATVFITLARKFRMLLHINPTRQRGKRTGSLARASGWYMTFFAAGVITTDLRGKPSDRPGNQACRPGYRAIEIGPFRAGPAIPPRLSPRGLGRTTARVCPDRRWHQSQPRSGRRVFQIACFLVASGSFSLPRRVPS